jgi:HEAT repeat protein
MWQDMNSNVRRAAGQALGKSGCGQAVHEEVVLRLQSQHWQDRVEALKLIGYIGERRISASNIESINRLFRCTDCQTIAAILQMLQR